MRFAFVSPCFYDRNYGGVQYTAQLAFEALGGGGGTRETKLLCYGPECDRQAAIAGQLCSQSLCSHSKIRASLDALRVRGWPDELLFWHLDLLKLLPFIGAGGKRVYLFLHGIEGWRTIGGATRRLLDRVDVFLTNSDFTWKKFVEMNPQCGGAEHRRVLLGVGAPEKAIHPPGDTPAAVIIGRMHKSEGYKGHRELITAWPLVTERIPAAELWIVGGGEGAHELRELASATGMAERVRFPGVVSEEEKRALLERSRCMVLPSRGEGFGLVYLEAMRLGRPCLSSIYDAGREVIDPPHAGIAVDPANSRDLAGAVVELLAGGSAWQERSVNAKRRYEEQFTAAHFQRRLLDAVVKTPARESPAGESPAGEGFAA